MQSQRLPTSLIFYVRSLLQSANILFGIVCLSQTEFTDKAHTEAMLLTAIMQWWACAVENQLVPLLSQHVACSGMSPLHYKLIYTHIKHQELPNQRSHTEIEDDICAFGHTSHSIVDGETELMNLHCTTTHDTTHTLLHKVRFLNAQTLGHVCSKAHYCWLVLANEILYRSSLLSHAAFFTIPTLQASDHAWEGFTLFSALGRCNS